MNRQELMESIKTLRSEISSLDLMIEDLGKQRERKKKEAAQLAIELKVLFAKEHGSKPAGAKRPDIY